MKDWNNLLITIPAAAMLCLASCTQNDGIQLTGAQLSPLEINALQVAEDNGTEVAAGTRTAVQVETRAATTSVLPDATNIGFFVQANSTNGYTSIDNRQGAKNGGVWKPTNPIMLNDKNATIAVYAPYSGAQNMSGALKLTAALRTDATKDLWCACFTANNQTTGKTVTMSHVYSRLIIKVAKDAGYVPDATFTKLTLTGSEIYKSGTAAPFTTTVPFPASAYGNTVSAPLEYTVTGTLNAATTEVSFDLLLIPAILATDDIKLTFTVNGNQMSTTLPVSNFSNAGTNEFVAGKAYNVGMKLLPGKLSVSSVNIVRWDDAGQVGGNLDGKYQ